MSSSRNIYVAVIDDGESNMRQGAPATAEHNDFFLPGTAKFSLLSPEQIPEDGFRSEFDFNGHNSIIGRSPALRRVLNQVGQVGRIIDCLEQSGQIENAVVLYAADNGASGVIFAHGARFGGHALFIKDRKLFYVYNFLGIRPEQQFVSTALKPGKYTLGMKFVREKAGPHHELLGRTKLHVNDKLAWRKHYLFMRYRVSLRRVRVCYKNGNKSKPFGSHTTRKGRTNEKHVFDYGWPAVHQRDVCLRGNLNFSCLCGLGSVCASHARPDHV